MGALSSSVQRIGLEDVDRIDLPLGSWSRMLVTGTTSPGTESSLGYSVFRPGAETDMVSHEVEELAFVVKGRGELRLEEEKIQCQADQALHIPAGTWHSVANTGDEDLVMVFTFPHPDYPPTERR